MYEEKKEVAEAEHAHNLYDRGNRSQRGKLT
jgi:hypothetical protein